MRKLLVLLTMILLTACNSEYNFEIPASEEKVFCNCLFTSDASWEVEVGYTYPFLELTHESWIDNALVFIVRNEMDTVWLTHSRKGRYINLESKPRDHEYYRLFVVVNNDTVSSTTSTLPLHVDFSILDYNENPGLIQYDYYTIDEVCEVSCQLEFEEVALQRIMIRGMTFDTIRAKSIYTFNEAIFKLIFEEFQNEDLIERIAHLDGDTLYGYDAIYEELSHLPGTSLNYEKISKIIDFAYIGELDYRHRSAFQKQMCFTNSPYFEGAKAEEYTLLGTFQQNATIQLYIWNFLEGEYWLQFKALSEEAYLYYQSYVAQLSNRIDYSSIMSPVYSNMSNGLGIFAGYSEKMTRVK
ncbi:MAG: DUF4249 family protein [Prolixibacteraceae bacterium]|nr:DUF4249 family protein [Prolixibacteraceae bacterium]